MIVFLVLFLLSLSLQAERVTPERFIRPPAYATRPAAAFRIKDFSPSGLERQLRLLEHCAELGFGTVLFRLPSSEPNAFWDTWPSLCKKAHKLHITIGFSDFRTRGEPLRSPLDKSAMEKHLNTMLSSMQNKIPLEYGETVPWYHFTSPSSLAPFWKNEKEFPHTLFQPFQKPFLLSWRKSFARPVRDLVQESGLHAGIDVKSAPIPPEELAFYFRYLILSPDNTAQEMDRNRRARCGARVMDAKQLFGSFVWPPPSQETAELHSFSWKPTADALLAEDASTLLIEFPSGLPLSDKSLQDLKIGCAYVQRCQWTLSLGVHAPQGLFVGNEKNLSLCTESDFIPPHLLRFAECVDGNLTFPSAKTYSILFIDETYVNSEKIKTRLTRWRKNHLPIQIIPPDAPPPLPPRLTWKAKENSATIRWLHRKGDQQEIFWIINQSGTTSPVSFTFRDPFSAASRWNPETGEITQNLPKKGQTIEILLDPAESAFLILTP